jgi:diguanylate cyclase (GGDEF)-like protein/putative nucleotidyltransferase with HDIG domain
MTLAEHPHIAEAMRERQTVVVRSQERHELALRGQTAVDKPWYYIMVPIATGEDVFGTVNIAVVDPQTTYDDQDLLMVETMCRHAAQALKNAAMVDDLEHAHAEMEKANTRLEELATTDDLTALANRRGFMAAIGLETERARRYGSDLALAMIDVDGFKAINDMCGHVFGDRVLVEVARAIEEGARAADLVARYGGDEIIVLMPNTDAQAAVSAVERIRRGIAGRVISDGQRSLEVAISAGISALDSKDRTAGPDTLIRQADEALYAAKHAGGNVTKVWSEIAEEGAGEIADEAAGVEDLQRKVAGLSLQAKEMVVQSLGGLVHALEARDAYTKGHSENVTRYAVAIAETLELDPEETAVIRRAALIHDIGKIAVPDSILRKRGALDDHERRIMQGHVLAGVKIIDQMHFLERETPIVRHHHEHWKGRGYPDGISGEAVPLGARILAVADAFDAITSNRVYRNARSVSDALRILVEESGRQFAPGVVDAMVKWVQKIGRELGKESDLAVADLLQSQPVPVPA